MLLLRYVALRSFVWFWLIDWLIVVGVRSTVCIYGNISVCEGDETLIVSGDFTQWTAAAGKKAEPMAEAYAGVT